MRFGSSTSLAVDFGHWLGVFGAPHSEGRFFSPCPTSDAADSNQAMPFRRSRPEFTEAANREQGWDWHSPCLPSTLSARGTLYGLVVLILGSLGGLLGSCRSFHRFADCADSSTRLMHRKPLTIDTLWRWARFAQLVPALFPAGAFAPLWFTGAECDTPDRSRVFSVPPHASATSAS